MRRVALAVIVIMAIGGLGCRQALPASTPLRPESPGGLAPSATAPPRSTTPTALPSPTVLANVDAPFVHADGFWGLGYLPAGLSAAALDERLMVFYGPHGAAVAAVDSYVGDADEPLLDRARQALVQAFGPGVQVGEVIEPERPELWETGLTFTAPDGVTGEAVYGRPFGRAGGYQVYGFLYACDRTFKVTQVDLKAMRRSFMAVAVQEVVVAGTDERLQLAYTHGYLGNHFLAMLSGSEAGSQRLAHAALRWADIVWPGTVEQVQLCDGDPSGSLWFEVRSRGGFRAGCYSLITYDGEEFEEVVRHCNCYEVLMSDCDERQDPPLPCHSSNFGVGWLGDIDGDGSTEVILNETDDYVFCYLCGVRYPGYRVLRCEGSDLVPLELTPLPEDAPAELRRLGNRAVALAKAGLWKDAEAVANEALGLGLDDPTWATDAGLIRLHAEAFRRQVEERAFPLVENAFYGDYAAALDVMRAYSPEELWGPGAPLANRFDGLHRSDLSDWLRKVTNQALEAEPDLAAACFLRGWATHLLDPAGPETLADVRHAAELAPEESLFAQGVAYLAGE